MVTRRSFLAAVGVRVLAAAGAVAATALTPAGPAVALSLDQARAAGWVGERPDGFLGLVRSDAPADVRALVDRINAERRARYADIASRTNTTAAKVGIVAGEKLISGTPRGQYIMTQDGRWVTR